MQKAVVCSFKFIANNISALSYKSVEVKILFIAKGKASAAQLSVLW